MNNDKGTKKNTGLIINIPNKGTELYVKNLYIGTLVLGINGGLYLVVDSARGLVFVSLTGNAVTGYESIRGRIVSGILTVEE